MYRSYLLYKHRWKVIAYASLARRTMNITTTNCKYPVNGSLYDDIEHRTRKIYAAMGKRQYTCQPTRTYIISNRIREQVRQNTIIKLLSEIGKVDSDVGGGGENRNGVRSTSPIEAVKNANYVRRGKQRSMNDMLLDRAWRTGQQELSGMVAARATTPGARRASNSAARALSATPKFELRHNADLSKGLYLSRPPDRDMYRSAHRLDRNLLAKDNGIDKRQLPVRVNDKRGDSSELITPIRRQKSSVDDSLVKTTPGTQDGCSADSEEKQNRLESAARKPVATCEAVEIMHRQVSRLNSMSVIKRKSMPKYEDNKPLSRFLISPLPVKQKPNKTDQQQKQQDQNGRKNVILGEDIPEFQRKTPRVWTYNASSQEIRQRNKYHRRKSIILDENTSSKETDNIISDVSSGSPSSMSSIRYFKLDDVFPPLNGKRSLKIEEKSTFVPQTSPDIESLNNRLYQSPSINKQPGTVQRVVRKYTPQEERGIQDKKRADIMRPNKVIIENNNLQTNTYSHSSSSINSDSPQCGTPTSSNEYEQYEHRVKINTNTLFSDVTNTSARNNKVKLDIASLMNKMNHVENTIKQKKDMPHPPKSRDMSLYPVNNKNGKPKDLFVRKGILQRASTKIDLNVERKQAKSNSVITISSDSDDDGSCGSGNSITPNYPVDLKTRMLRACNTMFEPDHYTSFQHKKFRKYSLKVAQRRYDDRTKRRFLKVRVGCENDIRTLDRSKTMAF